MASHEARMPDEPQEILNQTNISIIPQVLPHERVFPIQIGGELFKLSGASLSSDAPSYFSQHFKCQLSTAQQSGQDPATTPLRALCIDRDPITFRDIALHLQGYHVSPRDSTHFVRLFADAQFYNLPKLISRLYEDHIYISVGGRDFNLSCSHFADPGNSPNFFTLGFGFFQPSDAIFPGLDRESIIRPPSILPPAVPDRSADNFSDMVQMLRGYGVEIRSEEHRRSLLRDCRYFLFKGLEQRLIPHRREYNQSRAKYEIVLRLADILKSGISIVPDQDQDHVAAAPAPLPNDLPQSGWVHYARPYIDASPAELIVEIGDESSRLHFSLDGAVRVEFFHEARARVARLLEVIATKMNLAPTVQPLGLLMASGGAGSQPPTPGNTPLSDGDHVRVGITTETSIQLDGATFVWNGASGAVAQQQQQQQQQQQHPESNGDAGIEGSRKRRRTEQVGLGADLSSGSTGGPAVGQEWIVKNAHWRLRIQSSAHARRQVECVMMATKIDASSSEQSRNATKGFLA